MKFSEEQLKRLISGIKTDKELDDKDFSTVDADDMLGREYPGVSETLTGNEKKDK